MSVILQSLIRSTFLGQVNKPHREGAHQKHILKLKKKCYFENTMQKGFFSPFWSDTVYPCKSKVVLIFFLESCTNIFKYWNGNHIKSTELFILLLDTDRTRITDTQIPINDQIGIWIADTPLYIIVHYLKSAPQLKINTDCSF